MSIDPRRSGAALWTLWVAAGALGGGLATLLAFAWLGAIVDRPGEATPLPYDLRVLAYVGTIAAIAALFQSLLLTFIAPGKRAALLWILATFVGASLLSRVLRDLVFDVTLTDSCRSIPAGLASAPLAFEGTYAFGLGLAQGLVLVLVTRRKSALAVWIAGSLIALPLANYVGPHTYFLLPGAGATLIVSSAISAGARAAVTGLALLVILRLGHRNPMPVAPRAAAMRDMPA